ncbi:MAG TPA: hypothetical protein VGN07_00400 [Steroidobacteraceae bacterium]|jgi:hypothetical protein
MHRAVYFVRVCTRTDKQPVATADHATGDLASWSHTSSSATPTGWTAYRSRTTDTGRAATGDTESTIRSSGTAAEYSAAAVEPDRCAADNRSATRELMLSMLGDGALKT